MGEWYAVWILSQESCIFKRAVNNQILVTSGGWIMTSNPKAVTLRIQSSTEVA